MTTGTGNLDIQEKLRRRFQERLSLALPVLRAHKLAAMDPVPQDLVLLVHGLAGAGGTFGFPTVSTAAMALENHFRHDDNPHTVLAALDELILVIDGILSEDAQT